MKAAGFFRITRLERTAEEYQARPIALGGYQSVTRVSGALYLASAEEGSRTLFRFERVRTVRKGGRRNRHWCSGSGTHGGNKVPGEEVAER